MIAFIFGWKLAFVVVSLLPLIVISGMVQGRIVRGANKGGKKAIEEGGKVTSFLLCHLLGKGCNLTRLRKIATLRKPMNGKHIHQIGRIHSLFYLTLHVSLSISMQISDFIRSNRKHQNRGSAVQRKRI